MLDVRNQLVFFLMRCHGFYRQIKTDHPTSAKKHRQRQKDRCRQADVADVAGRCGGAETESL